MYNNIAVSEPGLVGLECEPEPPPPPRDSRQLSKILIHNGAVL